MTVSELPRAWRERAEQVRRFAVDDRAAQLWEAAAEELERALQEAAGEVLNLQQAAAESGYTADYLGRLVREGKIPNAGRKHAPKIRRQDLPRKATRRREENDDVVVISGTIGSSSFGRIAREAVRAKTFRRR